MTLSRYLLSARLWTHPFIENGLKRVRPLHPQDSTSRHTRPQSSKSPPTQPNRSSISNRLHELKLSSRSSTPSPSPSDSKDSPASLTQDLQRLPIFEPGSSWRVYWITFWFVVNGVTAAHLISIYVFSTNGTEGPSMLPTLNFRDDHVMISHLHANGGWVKAGDIVSFRSPMSREYSSIKRVIAMPGDFVWDSTPGTNAENGKLVQVPPGYCWVTGDNLEWSRDSRDFGMLPLYLIRGKVFARYLPLKYRGWLQNGTIHM